MRSAFVCLVLIAFLAAAIEQGTAQTTARTATATSSAATSRAAFPLTDEQIDKLVLGAVKAAPVDPNLAKLYVHLTSVANEDGWALPEKPYRW